ncbi:MAG: response regulator [Phycisphaerales bacterium]|nr:MAG: response regulator [Phycisphaerales bacterium]
MDTGGDTSPINALRLSDSERRKLLERLDRQRTAFRGRESRLEDRLPYKTAADVIVTLRHPGGSVVDYLVRPRNLSPQGIGFLHGNFVHPGSECQVHLVNLDRQPELVEGTVVRCRHVEGLVHEVGVRFEQPIALEKFVPEHRQSANLPEPNIELPRLSGRVVFVENSDTDRELLGSHLGKLGVEMVSIASPLEALALLEREKFELIITGASLPGLTGPELAEALRADGHEEPILALADDDNAETRDEALACGCTAVHAKPFTLEQLARWLSEYLPRAADSGPDRECLKSTEWAKPHMRPLILGFLEKMEVQVGQLAGLLAADADRRAIEKLSVELKGAAGGHGYPDVSRTAAELHTLSARGASPEELAAKCRDLEELCRRAGQIRHET